MVSEIEGLKDIHSRNRLELEKTIADLQQKEKELTQQYEELRQDINSKIDELTASKSNIAELQQKLNDTQDKLQKQQGVQDNTTAEKEVLEQKVQDLEVQFSKQEEDSKRQQNILSELQNDLNEQKHNNEENLIRLQDLLTVVENQKGKIDEQVEQINILEAQTGSKSSSLQQLENICKRLHQQNQQLSTQRDSFRSQIDEICSQNTILQEQHQHDLQSIQSVLDDSKKFVYRI